MNKDVQLNALLCQAVTVEEIDFPLVEKLLQSGADPIGRCSEEYEDENVLKSEYNKLIIVMTYELMSMSKQEM